MYVEALRESPSMYELQLVTYNLSGKLDYFKKYKWEDPLQGMLRLFLIRAKLTTFARCLGQTPPSCHKLSITSRDPAFSDTSRLATSLYASREAERYKRQPGSAWLSRKL